MELIIKPSSRLPCKLETFTINGRNADSRDFGDMYDHDEEHIELYVCGDMYFESKNLTKEVLDKYNITEEEYYDICNKLEAKLCIGRCGLCL